MTDQDELYAAFAAAHPNGQIFAFGRMGARYLISIEPGRTIFMVDGEPETRDFMAVFQMAIDADLFKGQVAVLVDLIRFTGGVDWAAVKAVHEMIDWRQVRRLRIAYLVRDAHFAPLAKIAGVIFPESRHQVFEDEGAALAWLAASNDAME